MPTFTYGKVTGVSGMGDVAVGPDGKIWLVGTDGVLWYLESPGKPPTRIPSSGFGSLSVDAEGSVWLVGGGTPWRFNRDGWTRGGATGMSDIAVNLASIERFDVWLTGRNDTLWTVSKDLLSYTPVPFTASRVSVGFDHRLWIVHNTQVGSWLNGQWQPESFDSGHGTGLGLSPPSVGYCGPLGESGRDVMKQPVWLIRDIAADPTVKDRVWCVSRNGAVYCKYEGIYHSTGFTGFNTIAVGLDQVAWLVGAGMGELWWCKVS